MSVVGPVSDHAIRALLIDCQGGFLNFVTLTLELGILRCDSGKNHPHELAATSSQTIVKTQVPSFVQKNVSKDNNRSTTKRAIGGPGETENG